MTEPGQPSAVCPKCGSLVKLMWVDNKWAQGWCYRLHLIDEHDDDPQHWHYVCEVGRDKFTVAIG